MRGKQGILKCGSIGTAAGGGGGARVGLRGIVVKDAWGVCVCVCVGGHGCWGGVGAGHFFPPCGLRGHGVQIECLYWTKARMFFFFLCCV